MNRITFLIAISICLIFPNTPNAFAKRFHKDGREIEILWKQKGNNKLKAWG